MSTRITLLAYAMMLFTISGLALAQETPIKGVAVMLNNGDIKVGYTKDYVLDKRGRIQIPEQRFLYVGLTGIYQVKFPQKYVCEYNDSLVLISSISTISSYKLPFENISYSGRWQVRSSRTIVKLQKKPIVEYHYDNKGGGGCSYWLLSYNPKISETELKTLYTDEDMDDKQVESLEARDVYMIWQCFY